jgi:UDP-glucuronate 4-epimerase
MNILITGVAGFIGYHLAQRLLAEGKQVYGIDNLNNYYDVALKQARLDRLLSQPEFTFQHLNISDRSKISELFQAHNFDFVAHLAAQAGVRYSLENPHAYIDSNLVGFANILEGCRHSQIKHLVFASSSSIYGNNTKVPFSVTDNVDQPISLYAATKKANELMAHSYSHLYRIPITGLRFFTAYGIF